MKPMFWLRIIFSASMLIMGISCYFIGDRIEGTIWIVGSIILAQLADA